NNPVYRSHSNCMEPEWIRTGTFLLSHKDSDDADTQQVVVSSSAIVQSFCRTDEKSLRVHHVEIYGVVPAFME
ncbi:hypothetical protein, partial [Blautia massiliensis (ex Durand et al. 2017)]|uniref:hypothetical protein n=1 Tax=Blautia massiliensis (ex Durand et al. 2017) TaxID=1737424 RepID=UPI0039937CE0